MREDLIRPMHGLASDWSHEACRAIKSYDDTIDLRNQIYPWITRVVAILAAGPPFERIFEYRYKDFTKEFRRATRALGLKDIVPYQCRHSGPSLDKAGQHRTMLEIKKQGRWKSDYSIARYKKCGRLAQIQSDLNKSQPTCFEATDLALEELIFWRHRFEDVLRPSLMVAASS